MRRSVLPLLLLVCAAAFADGGMMPLLSGAGANADQRAIIVYDEASRQETLVVTTQYRGAPSDFAWVLPVPALPAANQVSTWAAGNQAFENLQWQSEPQARIFGGMGCTGCGGLAAGSGGDSADTIDTGVSVAGKLNVDGLDISLLSATSAGELTDWLQTNGYHAPAEVTPVFAQYIAGGWHFVAVKVDATATAAPSITGYVPANPLKMTFHADQPVFPMRISAPTAAAAGSEVLLYVLAPHRMTVATYPTVAMSGYGLNTDSEEAFQASYNTKFTRLLNQPQGRAFVVEHAGWFPYGSSEVYYPDSTWYPQWLQGLAIPSGTRLYLTRLRTVLTPAQMTQDVLLTAAPTDEPVKILVSKARPLGGEATLAFVLACLIMTLACRRQGWGVKEFVVGTLLLGALVLGMIL